MKKQGKLCSIHSFQSDFIIALLLFLASIVSAVEHSEFLPPEKSKVNPISLQL